MADGVASLARREDVADDGGARVGQDPATPFGAPAPNRPLSPAMMLALQRTAGNRAAQALVARTRSRTLARRVPGDIRTVQIDASWARELTEAELAQQVQIVRDQLTGMAADDPVRPAALSNLAVLEAQVGLGAGRTPATHTAAAPRVTSEPAGVPRPAGLPLDAGFRLVQITDAPSAFVNSLPENQLVTVPADQVAAAAGVPGRSVAGQGVETIGTAGGVAVRSSSLWYQRYGFAAAGETSIGLVAVPRSGPYLGHTAMVLRVNGEIVAVRGFNPDMRSVGGLLDLATDHVGMEAGTARVNARLTNDVGMFRSGTARSVEWPVSAQEAQRALAEFPPEGLARRAGAPEFYTARPAVYEAGNPGSICTTQNCGQWAVQQIEQRFGGTVGRAGQPSITAVGRGGTTVPYTAHQPEIMAMLNEADAVAPLAGRGPAVVGGMTRNMRYLRIGGRVFFVVGLVVGGAEIATAAPEQRARTAASVGGGFVGGFALGAAAGLVCGPGAPVCSIVAGLTLGLVGSLAGAAIGEEIYDAATAPAARSTGPVYPGHSIVCPSCHDLGTGPVRSQSLETVFERARGSGPPRPHELTPQELEAIRRWLEPAPHAPVPAAAP